MIVWDTVNWAPVHRFTSDPLWNPGDWSNCEPALGRDGRRLATAYNGAFVIWDVTSGKRLSDPIYCSATLERLAFVGPGSARIEAMVSTDNERSRMSKLSWDYADVTEALDEKAIGHLWQLAAWVAGGDWTSRVPEFAAQTVGDPKVVKALFAHFAAQSRPERSNAPKAVDEQPAAR